MMLSIIATALGILIVILLVVSYILLIYSSGRFRTGVEDEEQMEAIRKIKKK